MVQRLNRRSLALEFSQLILDALAMATNDVSHQLPIAGFRRAATTVAAHPLLQDLGIRRWNEVFRHIPSRTVFPGQTERPVRLVGPLGLAEILDAQATAAQVEFRLGLARMPQAVGRGTRIATESVSEGIGVCAGTAAALAGAMGIQRAAGLRLKGWREAGSGFRIVGNLGASEANRQGAIRRCGLANLQQAADELPPSRAARQRRTDRDGQEEKQAEKDRAKDSNSTRNRLHGTALSRYFGIGCSPMHCCTASSQFIPASMRLIEQLLARVAQTYTR